MTYSSTILADSPYIYLRLNEASGTTAADTGSSGGTATISAGWTLGQVAAKYIDGTSIYQSGAGTIQKNITAWPTVTGHTIEFWYKRDTAYNPGSTMDIQLYDSNWGSFVMGIYLDTTGGNIQVRGGSSTSTAIPCGINDGGWHHIVVSYNGSTTTLYVDAVSKGTPSFSPGTRNDTDPGYLQFGNASTARHEYWDEVAYYTKGLTQAQVTAHYTAGATLPSTPVTVTPPVINMTNLTVPAPVIRVINADDTIVVPAMTANLTTAAPVVYGTASDTVAVPAITASLDMATAPVATHTYSPTTQLVTANKGFYYGAAKTDLWTFGNDSSSDQKMVFKLGMPTMPSGTQVTSAVFSVYSEVSTKAGNTVGYDLYAATSDWNETDNFMPSHGVTKLVSGGSLVAGSWNNIDITSQVKAWLGGATNYGLLFVCNGITGSVAANLIDGRTRATNNPYMTTSIEDIPPLSATVVAPAMTASLADPAPVVTARKNVSSTATIVDLGTVDLVAATSIATTDAITVAPVVTASLSFLGGASFNPDYATTATAITAGIATPNVKQFIEYNVLVQAPATFLGNLESEPVSVSLTTSRLTVVPVMSLSVKMVGIYSEQGDRYLAKLPSTLDADDIWYKMDEASGNHAVDSEATSGGGWKQSGYYLGSPTFRISDGPGLRPATRFDGIKDYMIVGPYTADNKFRDADPTDSYVSNAVTIEFSIRTTQENGVIFIGGGSGNADLASISQTYYSTPKISGNELRLEGGYIVAANAGVKYKARQYVADGHWHHVVMAIRGGDFFVNPTDSIQYDGTAPSYIAIDGQPILVRRDRFGGDGISWLPYSVGCRVTSVYAPDVNNNLAADPKANSFLAMDMRDFIVRQGSYIQAKDAEVIYYEWSDSTVNYPGVMNLNVSTPAPFRVKGNMKKMLAIYGLPYGYGTDGYLGPLDTYVSTLSGLAIRNVADRSSAYRSNTSALWTPVYPQVKTFTVGQYRVYPVDITGGRYGDADTSSVGGVLDRSSSFMLEKLDGTGYSGFVDDTTGLPRFINLQTDISNLADYDAITAVNYPWEKPLAMSSMQQHAGTDVSMLPNDAELCQGPMGLTNVEWTKARNDLRDSILQAAYDGADLWIGEYHMAQHLGFIGHYDVHDFGHLTGVRDTHALDLDLAHGHDSSIYLGVYGEYDAAPQLMHSRRVVTLIPGLTDLPSTETGDSISGWSYDRWKPNGDFIASDLLFRPNGLQVGDLISMGNPGGFAGNTEGIAEIPFVGYGINYGWFNASVGVHLTFNDPSYRRSVISARPDEIAGTPVTREMTGYYSDNGVWIDNQFKDNVLTIAAEVGTVVRGRAIAGRAFIELMDTAITPTMVVENQPLPPLMQRAPGKILRFSPSGFQSTWMADTRRNVETMATLTRSTLNAVGGGLGISTTSINYMNYTDTPVIYHRSETMHSRGLNWLAQTPTLNAGDVTVYQTAFTLTVTEPSAKVTQTSNPTVQVSAMRLDMEVRQPRNYLSGDVEVRTLPAEMFLDMKGRGAVVSASAMTIDLAAVRAVARADTEIIPVFLDSDSETIKLFLKEDN